MRRGRSERRVDPITGAEYYAHVAESDPREGRDVSGYVDPFAEFRMEAIPFGAKEVEEFDRVVSERFRPPPPPESRIRTDFFGGGGGAGDRDGPFSEMTRAMRGLLRPRRQVREVVALLGPLARLGDASREEAREIMRGSGAFLLESESTAAKDVYGFCEDPPPPKRPLDEENFEPARDENLEALLQERLRLETTERPFEYKFSWR